MGGIKIGLKHGGDFNKISSREERLGGGGHHNVRCMEEFREFFVRMGWLTFCVWEVDSLG